MSASPLLWYLNRSTGIVLIVVLSLAVALGVLALRGRAAGDGGGRIPRFVTQALHRNLALGALALLLVHVVTSVLDTYVDIRWWNALVPWGGSYQPVALALGTLGLDLMLAVAVTTAIRPRLGHRAWKVVHLAAWPAWLAGVVHGVLIGTDLGSPRTAPLWAMGPTALGVTVVVLAAAYRVLARPRRAAPAVPVPTPAPLPHAASPR